MQHLPCLNKTCPSWKNVSVAILCALAALLIASCAIFEDNGTHLAFALEHGARELSASGNDELMLEYVPTTGINQSYEIRLSPSRSTEVPYGGYIVVTGKNGGGTSHHTRFVYVPKPLQVSKTNASARFTLRKNGERIDVVDLR